MGAKSESQRTRALYTFFDNALDGVAYCQMLFDKQGYPVDFLFIESNKNFEKQTGLKDVEGKRITELIPGIRVYNPELFEMFSRVSLTGRPEKLETHVEPLSKWFLVSVYSPQKKFFVSVFQNITDRKQLEKDLENANIAAHNVLEDLSIEKKELERARAKEEAILLSIGDGLLVTNDKGNIVLINTKAEESLGTNRQEMIGKSYFKVIQIEDEKGAPILMTESPISRSLKTGAITATSSAGPHYYYVRKDKTRFSVAITAAPVILDGKVIGAIDIFRDITREKEIDKAKTEFVSLASHQLRTPLSTINWYSEMLLAGDAGALKEEQKKYINEVYKGNQRMVELVNALLNVSRLELGTFTVEPEPTDVVKVAQVVIDEQKPQFKAKKITFSEQFTKQLPKLNADPKLLRMVFQNLLSNAVKYTPDKGTVSMDIRLIKKGEFVHHQQVKGDSIAIVVSDTGYGITKSQQDKIFTKLFRADNVREKDSEGTGLGLYIVKAIIDHSGGNIWFQSEENKGSTFSVILPLAGMPKNEGTKTLT